jgi:hypothetical protein
MANTNNSSRGYNQPRRSVDFLKPYFDKQTLEELDQPISRDELDKQLAYRQADSLKRSQRPLRAISDRLISASELNKCSREIAYHMLPEEYEEVAPATPDKLALWEEMAALGDIHHARWQTLLMASNLVYFHPETGPAIEQYASDHATDEKKAAIREAHITVRFDLIFDVEGSITQGEIKTVQGKDFDTSLPWFFDKLKTPQAQISLWGLDLQQTTFIVINRDGGGSFSQYRIFTLDRDDNQIKALLAKANMIRTTVLAGGLPDPEPGLKRKACGLCRFKIHCPAWNPRTAHRYM